MQLVCWVLLPLWLSIVITADMFDPASLWLCGGNAAFVFDPASLWLCGGVAYVLKIRNILQRGKVELNPKLIPKVL